MHILWHIDLARPAELTSMDVCLTQIELRHHALLADGVDNCYRLWFSYHRKSRLPAFSLDARRLILLGFHADDTTWRGLTSRAANRHVAERVIDHDWLGIAKVQGLITARGCDHH